ncbi:MULTISPECIES: DmsE family decaheme c-type cytochrome [Oxalobacteraceae]|jgi:DmsE family decaheme c-type cytochrome|uniref:DmsE family decaheme c-type cytochrome n=1 Tax=Oxalobacteraceae TaxID=75682 RepID=UPI0010A46C2E|nr:MULTISPECIES: DmsE family decaheme c-type cytochrome [Oxalobacteraceae]
MKLWKKVVTLVTFAIGVAGIAPAFAADAAKPGATDLVLKGDAKCTACHDEADSPKLLAIGKTRHGTRADERTPTCTKCHGDSDKHADYKGKDKPPKPDVTFAKNSTNSTDQRSGACLSCHKKDANRSHWEGSTHQARDVTCSSCHTVHAGHDKVMDKKTQPEVCFACHKEQRAQVSRPSHHPILEGKVACSDCHQPHGSVSPKLMKRNSVNETCYTCHMEKRGPFVHNHSPVDEDCGNCHNPHGTVAESLLKARPPFLCHQCHTPHGGFIPQVAGAQVVAPTVNGAGKSGINVTQARACMNCHTQVHGSNNPSATNPTPQFMFR